MAFKLRSQSEPSPIKQGRNIASAVKSPIYQLKDPGDKKLSNDSSSNTAPSYLNTFLDNHIKTKPKTNKLLVPDPDYPGGIKIADQRSKYIKYDNLAKKNPSEVGVDFDRLVTSPGSRAFLDRYNHPVTRKRMIEQSGYSNEDIDNMIIRGLKAEKHIGSVDKGVDAQTWVNPSTKKDQMFFRTGHDTESTELHERVHASKMDEFMGAKLKKVLGDAFNQNKKSSGTYVPQKVKTYLNKDGEAYGNFADFREKLGLKPGEQIDVKSMRKIMKNKKIETNFSNVYDDDKIVKALNTIAYQGNSEASKIKGRNA